MIRNLVRSGGRYRGLRVRSLIVTFGLQSAGAPIIDQAYTVDDKGRRYGGWAIRPWRRSGLALVIGWRDRIPSGRPRRNLLTRPRFR